MHARQGEATSFSAEVRFFSICSIAAPDDLGSKFPPFCSGSADFAPVAQQAGATKIVAGTRMFCTLRVGGRVDEALWDVDDAAASSKQQFKWKMNVLHKATLVPLVS